MKLSLRSLDKIVEIETDDRQLVEYLQHDMMLNNHIPAYGISDAAAQWHINHRSNGPSSFATDEETRTTIVRGEFRKDTSAHDFAFLLLTVFSRLHEEEGRTVFHGSSVSDGEKAHIFLGARGGGKSILVTELVYKRGQKFVSGENVVVSPGTVLAGTAGISNRIPCIAARYPELLGNAQHDLKNYDAKLQLPGHYIEQHAALPQPIGGIYLVTINEALQSTQITQPHTHTLIYELFGNSSAYVCGLGHTMMNFSQAHPSLDTTELRRQRLNIVHSLIDSTPILEIRGKVQDIADHLTGDRP